MLWLVFLLSVCSCGGLTSYEMICLYSCNSRGFITPLFLWLLLARMIALLDGFELSLWVWMELFFVVCCLAVYSFLGAGVLILVL